MATKNISIPDKMLEQAKQEANELGISFSDYIKLLLSKQLNGFKFEINQAKKK